jgi:hypothetical protein
MYGGEERAMVGKPVGKRPLGIPRHRYDNTKIDLQDAGFEGMEWIKLAQDRKRWWAFVNAVMKLCAQ